MMTRTALPGARLLLWSILWMVTACDQPRGVPGATGVWVKGKSISIKANFVSQGLLLLSLRNDGTAPARVTPIQVTGWFHKAGKETGKHPFPDFRPEGGLVSAEYAVRGPADQHRTATIDKNSPDITLAPGEEITIGSPKFWGGDADRFDGLERAMVVVGPEGSAQQETFSISQKP